MNKLSETEVQTHLAELPGWMLSSDGKTITLNAEFKDFDEAMKYVNEVADIAKKENHHPDLFLSYNKLRIDLSTHDADGLTEADFTVAAKIALLD